MVFFLPKTCPFVLYSIIASSGQRISAPNFPEKCSWLFVYGVSEPSIGWTRIQAEPYTPEYQRAMKGRRLSRIFKINSHLLNISKPTVYIDTKRKIKNIDRVVPILKAMKKCNASMFSFLHPNRPHDLIQEFHAILTSDRTSNSSEVKLQERYVRDDSFISGLDAHKKTTVNDGSMIIRMASPALTAFEREWYHAYITGGDRDQPAFAIAHARMFGERKSDLCGNAIWTIPHQGIKALSIDGHDAFT